MRLGVLTSGGDCAGLNAALRAVVRRAIQGYGWEVFGIEQGVHGLLGRPPRAREIGLDVFDGSLMRQAGTILGTTNKGDPFAYPMADGSVKDRSAEVIEGLRILGIDALIGIGGDGSQAILRRLATQGGFGLVTIPKTIDNDVAETEVSVGYDTAVSVATEALDRLQPTAASHSRVMVLEVMGRDAGHIALVAGIAGGADVILIPEIPWTMGCIARQIKSLHEQGRNFALVVVAEAIKTEEGEAIVQSAVGEKIRYGGVGHYIGARIAEETGSEVRVTVLGHIQRGGAPSARDRLIAAAFGVHAVDLVAAGRFDRMVAWRARQVIDVPIADAIARPHMVDPEGPVVRTARGLGICLGDG